MEVRVVEPDPRWPELFSVEAERVKKILGSELVAIHHIGSTAVENLAAKPIIDIMPVVKDIEKVDAFSEGFAALGYEVMGEYGIPGRRYFRKGNLIRTHHVHIFAEGNRHDIDRHLALRDYLRAHPDVAAEYGELKQNLARTFPNDINAYMDGKDSFVKRVEAQALRWYYSERKPFTIRPVEERDKPELVWLIAAFRVELSQLKEETTEVDLGNAEEELNSYLAKDMPIFVAEGEGGKLLGYIVCRVDGDVVWAEYMYVLPEMRRQGVATMLYSQAEKLAADLGQDTLYNWVHPNNKKIIAFLAKLGYNVLNLIEIRKAWNKEELHRTIEVDGQEYRY
jgi:GrpB-like predicted nucleotidyltransferase (UPF0157 family)/ribosomal protein S18 acetylase RimI-like enzyme